VINRFSDVVGTGMYAGNNSQHVLYVNGIIH
jgi:hypothetical protein